MSEPSYKNDDNLEKMNYLFIKQLDNLANQVELLTCQIVNNEKAQINILKMQQSRIDNMSYRLDLLTQKINKNGG